MDVDPEEGVMLRSDFTTSQSCRTAFFFFLSLPSTEAHVQYNLTTSVLYDTILRLLLVFSLYDTIWWLACVAQMYNINLGATATTILSIRGVMIPINLVSSATDSNRRHVVLFKPVPIPTSDPKSEFLCQSSVSCSEPADSPEHLVRLGYLPCPRHHVSPILP